jgi:hypothetical protein
MTSKKDEAVSAIMRHKAFTEEIAEMIVQRGGVDRALMALEREFYQTITVPDLHHSDLLDLVKTRCDLTSLYYGYRGYDLFQTIDGGLISGRGRVFRFLIWKPQRKIASTEVREYFEAKGFYGHAPAFMAWLADKERKGSYASIPNDKECFRMNARSGTVYAPCFQSAHGQRKLDWQSCYYGDAWDEHWSFIGFSEIGRW